MKPEAYRRLKDLYRRVQLLPLNERADFVERECGDDSELRQELEELIAAGSGGSGSGQSSSDEASELEAGRTLTGRQVGHYQVRERIGHGAMGVVYRAEDLNIRRTVALKFVAPHLLRNESVRRRFLREARAAAVLDHPNVCPVYEIGEDGDGAYIAMELIEGKTLRELLAEERPSIEKAIHIVREAARGLDAAHKHDIVHRDIKPENIMVAKETETGEQAVRVLDFGVARLAEQTDFTASGTVLGTAAYMAPEQITDKRVDARADIWSLGVVLYEAVTGVKPFPGSNIASVLHAVRHDQPKPASALREDVPARLDAVIRKALAKDPKDRHQSARELRKELRLVRQASEPAFTASGTPRTLDRPPKPWRRPSVWIGTVAATALLGMMMRPSAPETETVFRPVPWTADPGAERDASFSADGLEAVFVRSALSGGEGGAGVFVKSLESGEERRLTSSVALDRGPVWSPDGNWVAFSRSAGVRPRIMIVSVEGGEPKELARGTPRQSHLEWTPDSKGLLCVRPTDTEALAIWRIDVESGETVQVTHPPPLSRGDRFPKYSPDGATLAFVRSAAGTQQVHLQREGDVRRLPEAGAGVYRGLAWAQDGRSLVFARASRPQQATLLWRVAASGDEAPFLISGGALEGARPAVARAGNRMLFERVLERADLFGGLLPQGGGLLDLPATFVSSGVDSSPRFSPDGSRIAFLSDRSGWVEVWTAKADGSGARQVSRLKTRAGSPDWSPDGRSLIFDAVGESGQDLYAADVETGRVQPLLAEQGTELLPRWSADGRSIYYTWDQTGNSEIWKIPAEGGEPIRQTRGGGFAALESPDGRWLYFSGGVRKPGLFRQPTEGGEVETVLTDLAEADRFRWLPYDGGVYYLDRVRMGGRRPSWALLDWRESEGQSVIVARLGRETPNGLAPFDLTDGGRRIAVSKRGSEESDLMLVEKFR